MCSAMTRVHASCVAIDGRGVLLRGPSGSGKSDLALRLIDAGARLVADDQTELTAADGEVIAAPPTSLAGLMEVRGLGVVRMPDHAERAPVRLVIDLVPAAEVERMPAPASVTLAGIALPRLALAPFEASAPAKVRLALLSTTRDIIPPP